MTPLCGHNLSRRYHGVFLTLLFIAAVVGNYLSFSVFLGPELFFGSIAVLITVYFFGVFWGIVAAVISVVSVFMSVNIDVQMIVFILEPFFLGSLLKRIKNNLLLADGLFWLLVGMPLLLILSKTSLGGLQPAAILAFKFAINGIFNALMASLILFHTPLLRWLCRDSSLQPTSLYQTMFNLLVALVLIPSLLLLVLYSQNEVKNLEERFGEVIQEQYIYLVDQLESWKSQHIKALSELGRVALEEDIRYTEKLQFSTEFIRNAFPDFLRVHVDNAEAETVTFSPSQDSQGRNLIGTNFADRPHYQEMYATGKPVLSDVFVARVEPSPIAILGVPILAKDQVVGFAVGALDLDNLFPLISNRANGVYTEVTLIDRKRRVVVSTRKDLKPLQNFLHEKSVNNYLDIFRKENDRQRGQAAPLGSSWEEAHYDVEYAVGENIPWVLVFEHSLAPYRDKVENLQLRALGLLVALIYLVLGAAAVLSYLLVRPISSLAAVTTDLPTRLVNKAAIQWPKSLLTELDLLVNNFKAMVASLQIQFQRLNSAKAGAEEEKRKLEAILAGTGYALNILDKDHVIIYQNDVHKEMVGNCVGKPCYEAMNNSWICEDCPVKKSFADGKLHTFEKSAKTDKGEVYLEITASPLKDAQGNVVSVIEIVRDITERKIAEDALRKSEERYRDLFENANDLIQSVNPEGRYLFVNKAWKNTMGYSDEEIVQLHITDVLHPDHYNHCANLFRKVLEGQDLRSIETVFVTKDGRHINVEGNISCRWENGKPAATRGIFRDVTERKKAEQAIWEEKERAQVTLKSIGDGVITTDSKGRVDFLNPVAEGLTGWTSSEARGKPLMEVFRLIDEKTGAAADSPVETCLRESRVIKMQSNCLLVHKDGYKFAIEDSAAPIRNREGDIIGAVLVFHNVTEKRSILQQLVHRAYHDPLTELPNRILFDERLKSSLTYAARNNGMLAVFMLDLDQFKVINDTLGHAMGDKLLKEVALRLKGLIKESHTLARLGGDEFIILLPAVSSLEKVARRARKILEGFHHPWIIEDNEFHITASIGIAIYPNDGSDAETLIKHADTAMYRAKEQGRNNYQLFAPEMNERVTERLAMENSLHKALKKKELTVYYQPQVNTQTGKIVGMEALVRWRHPEKGMISPADFISLAEDTGLIIPIGEWVLRTACAQNKAWQDLGYPPAVITVNISARQFQQGDLVKKVSEILEETCLDPAWLELEITESVAMQDVDFSIQVLKQLRSKGIKIAIDDFGTGYSSLYCIKQFPINTLKIDRTFVKDVNNNKEDAAIVSTVVVLAKNLNLNIVAEGVETEEQLSFFKGLECYNVQGFLFSKPIPPKELERLLKNQGQFF